MPTVNLIRKKSSVYFIQAADDGPIKIGYTSGEASFRLSTLQGGSPVRLRLLGLIKRVERHYEWELHERFQALRLHGEWFAPGEDLLQFVAEHAITPGSEEDEPEVVSPAEPEEPLPVPYHEPEEPVSAPPPPETIAPSAPTSTNFCADPMQLRVIVTLLGLGWTRVEISRGLRISRATYYRRLEDIARLRAEAAAGRDDDD